MESHSAPDAPAPIAAGEAAAAMAAIEDSRAWLAQRVIAPAWHHPALGVLTGAAIAAAEARSWALVAWSIVAYTIGCGVVMWVNQRRVGVAMRYFDACTRAVFAVNVLALSALIALACWLELSHGVRGAFAVAGLLAFLVTVLCGRWTDRVLRARVRAGR